MKIEFLEQDEEGQHVIAIINGKRKILPTSKTILEILKMPGIPLEPTASVEALLKPEYIEKKKEEFLEAKDNENLMGVADSTEIQREDLVRIVNLAKGLSDSGGNELAPRTGVIPNGVYRVLKVNQTVVAMPSPDGGEPVMTRIVNNLEVIDDSAARPERLTLFPHEVVLHKKRDKSHSVVKAVFSEILKCAECGASEAFILDGNTFKGKCVKCGFNNAVERVIELCSNEACADSNKKRTQVSLFLYGNKYTGQCGTCKTGMEKVYGPINV